MQVSSELENYSGWLLDMQRSAARFFSLKIFSANLTFCFSMEEGYITLYDHV